MIKQRAMMLTKAAFCLTGLIIILALMNLFTFSSTSICCVCGLELHRVEYQLPHSFVTYKQSYYERKTKLSKYLNKQGWQSPHVHDYQFIHGGGNGVACALGNNQRISNLVNNQRIINLLELHRKFEGAPLTKDLIISMMSKKYADIFVCTYSSFVDYPICGFRNHDEFVEWKNEFSNSIDLHFPK